MVHGCFSWQSIGPIRVRENAMDIFVYKNMLETVMLPDAQENKPLLREF